MKINLAEDTIDQQDIRALTGWLQTNPWLTQGKLVREFETKWSEWLGCRYSVFVNSGSSANLLMVYAHLMKEPENKKIVVPAVSWATTVAPAIQFGMEPILCEADSETFGLDLNHLELILKKHHPAAVMPVHVLGVPNKMNQLSALQEKYGFSLLEDACAATGSAYQGKRVGTFGAISSFSFFFGHHISTIEGGMVSTSDKNLYDILLQLRSHGWAKDLEPEQQREKAENAGALEFNRPFTFYYPGFNVRSTDLNAFIGLGQMKKIDRVVSRRAENHRAYQSAFEKLSGFQFQKNTEAEISSIAFCALAPSLEDRDRIGACLRESGIETRPLGGGNMSRQPFWKKFYPEMDFPVADRIMQSCFQLPNHPALSSKDIAYIAHTVQRACEKNHARH